jgi:hypothetical protein
MRKLDFDRFAQWDRTALLELGDTIEEQIRREAEEKKAEETKKARKKRKKRAAAAR